MQFEGRTGDARPKCYGEIVYDDESQRYRIRVDDAANPGFWLVVWLSQSLMDEAASVPGTTLSPVISLSEKEPLEKKLKSDE
jgi:hypothetical protein